MSTYKVDVIELFAKQILSEDQCEAKMKLAIIGAGVAGLGVLKEALKAHLDCTVFEQGGKIGGLWNYSETTDVDEDGLPIHSAVYEGMTTHVPKELMAYDGFPHEKPDQSYVSHEYVLNYIQKFADRFNLSSHVQFYTEVIRVEPLPKSKWWIKTKNVHTHQETEYIFDAVVVCNGHFYVPRIPNIPGADLVKDISIHSRDYRTKQAYKNKVVLIVGGGRSGADIGKILATVAKKVLINVRGETFCPLDPSCVPKPGTVKYFTRNSAVFEDGSEEIIDKVIYCTGFKFTFPFLSPACGISCDENWVRPLYKHIININHPTMAIISVNDFTLTFPLCGLQARFFLAFLKAHFFKTKEEMMEDLVKEIHDKQERGVSARRMHTLGIEGFKNYTHDIATTAGIYPLPAFIAKSMIHVLCMDHKNLIFRVINDEEFEITLNP